MDVRNGVTPQMEYEVAKRINACCVAHTSAMEPDDDESGRIALEAHIKILAFMQANGADRPDFVSPSPLPAWCLFTAPPF